MDRDTILDSLDNGIGKFNTEESTLLDDMVPLFDVEQYP